MQSPMPRGVGHSSGKKLTAVGLSWWYGVDSIEHVKVSVTVQMRTSNGCSTTLASCDPMIKIHF